MAQAAKSVLYVVGFTALGGALFLGLTPSPDSATFQKMKEDQGVLSKDVSDAERNKHNLMKKLKQSAGGNQEGRP